MDIVAASWNIAALIWLCLAASLDLFSVLAFRNTQKGMMSDPGLAGLAFIVAFALSPATLGFRATPATSKAPGVRKLSL